MAEISDDPDRYERHATLVSVAFRLGFLAHAMATRLEYGDPAVLQALLYRFSTEFAPNGFDVLTRSLHALQGAYNRLHRSGRADAEFELYNEGWTPGRQLSEWFACCGQFADLTRQAVPESCLYRNWFVCGRLLGECRTLSVREPIFELFDLSLELFQKV